MIKEFGFEEIDGAKEAIIRKTNFQLEVLGIKFVCNFCVQNKSSDTPIMRTRHLIFLKKQII